MTFVSPTFNRLWIEILDFQKAWQSIWIHDMKTLLSLLLLLFQKSKFDALGNNVALAEHNNSWQELVYSVTVIQTADETLG